VKSYQIIVLLKLSLVFTVPLSTKMKQTYCTSVFITRDQFDWNKITLTPPTKFNDQFQTFKKY